MFHHGDAVIVRVLVGPQTPLVEIPRALEGHSLGIDTAQLGHDVAESPRVVTDDAVEVDAQHEMMRYGRV